MRTLVLALLVALLPGVAAAQVVPPPAKSDRGPVEHGARPDPGAVRPGSPEGDAPSAAAGELVARPARRVFGLPVTTALVIAGVLVALLVLAGVVIPSAGRRRRARGGGTYGGR
jgi:hypothetical protein